MAIAKTATLVGAQNLGANARLLTLELAEPLGFVGGQYLIFDPGLVLEGGRLAKRAYSILSRDAEPRRIEIAVKRIGVGLASNYMHSLPLGAELRFSGPWGKYLPDDRRTRPVTWVLATDTGITAALGLLRGDAFAPQLPHTELVWLVEPGDYFVSESFVRERLPSGLRALHVEAAPPVDHHERLERARALVEGMLARARPESVFLSGDGRVILPLREQLIARGVSDDTIRSETFFHHARKATQAA